MTDNKYPQESAYNFLENLKDTFLQRFSSSEIDNAISYSLNGRFKEAIKEKMEIFNKNFDAGDNLKKLRQGVSEFHSNVMQADELLSIRGEKINLIVKKAENMRNESQTYYGAVIDIY
jgi:hypothetical protein